LKVLSPICDQFERKNASDLSALTGLEEIIGATESMENRTMESCRTLSFFPARGSRVAGQGDGADARVSPSEE